MRRNFFLNSFEKKPFYFLVFVLAYIPFFILINYGKWDYSNIFALIAILYIFLLAIRNNWIAIPLIIFTSQLELGFGRLINLPVSFSQLVFFFSFAAFLAGRIVKRKSIISNFDKFDFYIIALFVWIILSSIVAQDLDFSPTGITRQLSFVVLYFFVSSVFESNEQIRRAIIFWGLLSVNLIFFQILEARNIVAQFGTYFGRNSLALELAIAGIMALMIGLEENRRNIKRLFYSLTLLFILGIFINTSRGVLISFVTALSILLLIRKVKISKVVLLGVTALILVWINAQITNNSYSNSIIRLQNTNLAKIENETRFIIWDSGLDMISDNLLFGVGFNNFEDEVLIRGRQNNIRALYVGKTAHNMFLSLASEVGLPGLVVFIAILVIGFKSIFQNIKIANSNLIVVYPIFATLLVLLIQGFFADVHRMASFWMVLGLIKSVHRISNSQTVEA